jgi:hypothetical protein
MVLETPVDLASCCKSRRPCSIDPSPASQVEALDVKILLSSQGSRIVSVEKSSSVYSFLVRAQGSTPRIDRSFFSTLLFVASANVKCCTLNCSRFAPHYGRLFGPLSPIVINVTIIRRHDVALLSISATVVAMLRLLELTIVELRLVYARYPTGSTDRYSPASVIKWNRLTGTADTKTHFPSKLDSITVLVLFPPTSIPSSKLFSRVRSQRREEAQSRPKAEINPSCHP